MSGGERYLAALGAALKLKASPAAGDGVPATVCRYLASSNVMGIVMAPGAGPAAQPPKKLKQGK